MPDLRAPAWLRLFVGWMAAAAVLESLPPPEPVPPGVCTLELDPLPPALPGTRAWRSVEGVGRRRALALARARWEAGGWQHFDPETVPGIGPITGERVRRFLREAYARDALHSQLPP